jgi:hypothetical protein
MILSAFTKYAISPTFYGSDIIYCSSKESWPKGPGFGLPLKGAVSLKARQVKSA